ncbi:MAG: aminofutalosine synthase MqnE [Armatimonadetes bacterium]|nr:aminofutalosine synthase MqnE [Armatimonadota bacterium]
MQTVETDSVADLEVKVRAGERLTRDEGLRLYRTADVESLYRAANFVREKKNGRRAYYNVNMHLNYSNICTDSCMFCAFGKKRGDEGAYEMSLEEIYQRAGYLKDSGAAEVHIVGGLHPDYPYEYYLEMIRGIDQRYPNIHIKAFTAVEIDLLAKLSGKSWREVLQDLKAAGMDSMPGGGAEVLSDRVFRKLCPDKTQPDEWLAIHKTAHEVGFRSNATMLFGHVEKIEERVDHLLRLRALQDETGGFMAFIPLRFHPENTALQKLPMVGADEVLRNIAVGRLMLDNFDHIKAYWIQVGLETARDALNCGADDFDGTVLDERITHFAGARTPIGVQQQDIWRLIREAGCVPVRRDSCYNEVEVITAA